MEPAAIRQFVELEERHFWFIGRRRIFGMLLERELAGRRDAAILDVGCGAGGMFGLLAAYGEVQGLDPSAELVAYCHSRGFPQVSQGRAEALPVAADSLDLITLFDTIEHIPDDRAALREAHRALRPGGRVLISVPAYRFLYANNDRVAQHQRRYTASELRAKLTQAGFQPLQVSYFNTLLFPLILPAVLVGKALERIVDPGERTNLTHQPPAALNRLLAWAMGAERHVLRRWSLPVGHSILAVAAA